jgi:exodeoxyribonuclease III
VTVTTLTVATWNVNSIGAHIQQVLGWVGAHQPSVLAMQETQCTSARFPQAEFEALGYEIVAHGDGGSNGVALASRIGLHDIQLGVPGAPPPFDEPRILSARVDAGARNDAGAPIRLAGRIEHPRWDSKRSGEGARRNDAGAPIRLAGRIEHPRWDSKRSGEGARRNDASVRVVCAYAPNGRKVGTDAHAFKVAWFELLRAVVEHADEPDVVVAADLNVAPTDHDVWDAHRYRSRNLTSPEDRRAYQRLIDAGLVDVVRKHSGSEKLSSWWNRRGDFFESDRGWRLDHVLANSELAVHSVGVHIDREIRRLSGGSDHAPITATFELDRSAD